MNDGKSDTHSNFKLRTNEEAEEFINCVLETYTQKVPKHQRSPREFAVKLSDMAWNLKMNIRSGNYNTAEPNSIILPNGTIEVYISDECSPCGKKQLLYWCIMMLTDKQFFVSNTDNPIFEIADNKEILSHVQPPPIREMDKNSFAMQLAKKLLKRLF